MTDFGSMARGAGQRLWRPDTLPTLFRYVFAGGIATAVNFLVRIPLTELFGFEVAVILAQAVGFCVGFLLYRSFVFTGASTTLKQQIAAFGGVNLVAAGAVICVAISLHLLLLAAGIPDFHAEWIAHAAGLATGAPLNFSGHFLLTFRSRRA
jgi:energy-coupling factor transport system substrate-specific component